MPDEPKDRDAERAEAQRQAQAKERSAMVGRAGIVGVGTLFSRVLGLLRDAVLAAVFPKAATDAFFVAFTIPNALRQLLGEGAVSGAVVPVLAAKLENEGLDAGRAFFAKIRGVSLLALTIVSVLGVVYARPLTRLFASGYNAEQFERTVIMTRIVFPYVFFVGTTALGMAALNARKQFFVTSFAPALLNVGFVVAAFTMPAPLRAAGIDPALAIAGGALLGGVWQVIAQWPSLMREGFMSMPKIDFRDPSVREVFRRMGPMTLGVGIYYIDLIFSRRFLSELPEGSQSHFTWASRICDFPQGIFVMALSTAALPSLSALHAKSDHAEFARTFSLGLRLSLFVAIPASVLLIAFANPVVAAFFQRGEFHADSTHETARALVFQGSAIWAVACVRQLTSAYYARGDTRTPVIVSILDLGVFLILAWKLRGPMGHAGVSAAVAGSTFAQMVLLFVFLVPKMTEMRWGTVALSFARVALVSAIAALIVRAAMAYFPAWAGTVAPGVVAVLAFGILFLLGAKLARAEELEEVLGGVIRKLRRR